MTPGSDALARLLRELREIAPADDGPVIDDLQRRLSSSTLRVLVVGEAKRGKSTLLNALLGRDVLPTGVVPVTAVATTLRAGAPDLIVAHFRDGTVQTLPLSSLADLVTEERNPENRRGVRAVEVQLEAGILDGAELVDTPGVGSVHAHNTAEAEAALKNMDAAVVVLTADPPISASEKAFLRNVQGRAVRLFCVLNKVDRLDPEELRESLAFTRRVLLNELHTDVPVYPLAARSERRCSGSEPGFAQFARDLGAYLRSEASEDLLRSLALHAARIATAILHTQEVALAALALDDQELSERLQHFRTAAAAVERRRRETAAIVSETFRSLQNHLAKEAAAAVAREAPSLVQLTASVAATAQGSAAAIEHAVMAAVATRIEHLVEDWRADRAAELAAAIPELDLRLIELLAEQIATVRAAAAEQFGVAMPTPAPQEPLAVTGELSYSFAPDPGPVDSLTAAVRTHLPTRWARGRIEAHLRDRALDLLDRHIGRSAAGLRAELADGHRRFQREMDRRFAEGAGRMAEAVEAAAALRTGKAPLVAGARAQAQTTADRARQLLRAAELAGEPVCQPMGERSP